MFKKSFLLSLVTLWHCCSYGQTNGKLYVFPNSSPNRIYFDVGASLEINVRQSLDSILLETDNGEIQINDDIAIYRPGKIGKAIIHVKKLSPTGDTILLEERRISVQPFPAPQVYLNNQTGGEITITKLSSVDGLTARFKEFEVDLGIFVKRYTTTILRKGSVVGYYPSTGNYFSNELKKAFQKLKADDLILFTEIEVETTKDNKTILSLPLVFKAVLN